jgi:glycosyltransferase A (GT-A) superfamily protein (DUF2064 family)
VGTDEKRGPLEIAVFARAPVRCRVKTRLAEEIGASEALEVYSELLERTIAAVVAACRERGDLVPVLWHLGDWPGSFSLPPQIASSLRRQPHEEMLENLREVFRPDPHTPRRGAIAVGADHPAIDAACVLSMASLLDGADVAVGPAMDGGFWSLGAVVDIREALLGLPVGTETALSSLERAARCAGFSVRLGPTLLDVDTADDLRRWRGQIHRE